MRRSDPDRPHAGTASAATAAIARKERQRSPRGLAAGPSDPAGEREQDSGKSERSNGKTFRKVMQDRQRDWRLTIFNGSRGRDFIFLRNASTAQGVDRFASC